MIVEHRGRWYDRTGDTLTPVELPWMACYLIQDTASGPVLVCKQCGAWNPQPPVAHAVEHGFPAR
jgi:hypothetical protein